MYSIGNQAEGETHRFYKAANKCTVVQQIMNPPPQK